MKTMMKMTLATGLAASFLFSAAFAQQLAPLNSDTEKDRMAGRSWKQNSAPFRSFPTAPRRAQFQRR